MEGCIIVAHLIKYVAHTFSLKKYWIGVVLSAGFSYFQVNMVCSQMIVNFLICYVANGIFFKVYVR